VGILLHTDDGLLEIFYDHHGFVLSWFGNAGWVGNAGLFRHDGVDDRDRRRCDSVVV
jgi:hypothetical protein